ncbi:DUF4173 domain-containing protein [Jannaschia pohangensis]|uniref:Uncharacterized protein n=1 Tax=Jannaschia pohangensis TaxID=390807 RepID=A0A1I3USL1_9RHOB|nr:DUF4173 domain-containing protein [Jannaschia pohangensis]SFJ85960.1 protein of unknown function [Jannaschia pohangensis]
MAEHLLIRGLPRRLAQDGWWMTQAGEAAPPPPPTGPVTPGTTGRRGVEGAALLLALIALGDLLFWDAAPGLSLALFAVAVFAAAIVTIGATAGLALPLLTLLFAILPVIETVQTLSVAILLAGLALSITLLDGPSGPMTLARSVARRLLSILYRLPIDGLDAARDLRKPTVDRSRLTHLATGWALPLGGALVLAALLLESNPVFDGLLSLPDGPSPARLMFWSGLALIVWPFLQPTPAVVDRPLDWRTPAFLNGPAVARALVVFNAMIAVQSGLDIAYLWSGADLPSGISLAEYAHRGAYPLLATALLAGVFAAAARPFVAGHPILRALVLLWLAQNLLATASAVARLDIYVGELGLTYLRIHAAVWMGVVAAGLVLTAWGLLRNHTTAWLMVRCTLLGLVTLYTACFVNFGAIIARHNVALDEPDWRYLCTLPANTGPITGCSHDLTIDGWRDWTFRDWRASRYTAPATQGVRR